jgi:hypothetical protein
MITIYNAKTGEPHRHHAVDANEMLFRGGWSTTPPEVLQEQAQDSSDKPNQLEGAGAQTVELVPPGQQADHDEFAGAMFGDSTPENSDTVAPVAKVKQARGSRKNS